MTASHSSAMRIASTTGTTIASPGNGQSLSVTGTTTKSATRTTRSCSVALHVGFGTGLALLGPDETVHDDQRAQQAPRQVDEDWEPDRQRPPVVGVRGSRRDRLRHQAGKTGPGNGFSRHLAGQFRDNSQHAHQHECERQHPDEQADRERAGHDAAADVRVSFDSGQRDVDRAVALALRSYPFGESLLVLGDPLRPGPPCGGLRGLRLLGLHGGAVCPLRAPEG